MDLLLIVGAYDEIATIEPAIEQALASCRAAGVVADVLVVDDGSPDGTGEMVAKLAREDPAIHLLQRPVKLGLGSALRDGVQWGLDRSYRLFGFMDADLSHDPSDIPRLVEAMTRADLVIGSRYVPGGGVVGWPLHRRLLSQLGNLYVRAVTGIKVRDATAGFRVFSRELVEAMGIGTLQAEGYSFEIELTLRSWREGWRIVEVPIVFRERTTGVSKMSGRVVREAVWRVALWGRRGRRGPLSVVPGPTAVPPTP